MHGTENCDITRPGIELKTGHGFSSCMSNDPSEAVEAHVAFVRFAGILFSRRNQQTERLNTGAALLISNMAATGSEKPQRFGLGIYELLPSLIVDLAIYL